MLHYNPRYVSSINMPIFRRTNCIITASGIVALCKRLHSMPDESNLQSTLLSSGILCCTVLYCIIVLQSIIETRNTKLRIYAGRPGADGLKHAVPSAEHGTGHAFESWFYLSCYEVFFNTLYKRIFCHDSPSKPNTLLLGRPTSMTDGGA